MFFLSGLFLGQEETAFINGLTCVSCKKNHPGLDLKATERVLVLLRRFLDFFFCGMDNSPMNFLPLFRKCFVKWFEVMPHFRINLSLPLKCPVRNHREIRLRFLHQRTCGQGFPRRTGTAEKRQAHPEHRGKAHLEGWHHYMGLHLAHTVRQQQGGNYREPDTHQRHNPNKTRARRNHEQPYHH